MKSEFIELMEHMKDVTYGESNMYAWKFVVQNKGENILFQGVYFEPKYRDTLIVFDRNILDRANVIVMEANFDADNLCQQLTIYEYDDICHSNFVLLYTEEPDADISVIEIECCDIESTDLMTIEQAFDEAFSDIV